MDNSKATTGGEGLLKHGQNSSAPEIMKPNVGSDAAEQSAKPSTWAQITNENSHLLPSLPKDGNKHLDKLPHLELLCYEIAAQHLINAIANSSKQLTGHDLFHQPGHNLARLFKHLGESNEQLKSFDKDKEVKPAALSHAVSEIKTGSAQSTAPNPFLLFGQVSLKENAAVDSAGKKTVSEPLVVKASTAETTQLDQTGLAKVERTAGGGDVGAKATLLPEVTLGPLTVSKAHPVGSLGSDSAAPVIALSQLLVNNPDNGVKNALMTTPAAAEQGAKGDAKVATAHALDHHGSKVESNQTLVAALKSDSPTTTSSTTGARVESTPVLVAATKLDNPVPVPASADLRAETAPVLVAATKLDVQTPVAPTPGVKVEVAPTLVAATKLDVQAPVAPTPGVKVEAAPTLVAATKLDVQAPVAPTPGAKVEAAPTLVAATKLDVQAPVAPTPGVKVEAAPTLVAATKLDSHTPVAPTPGTKVEAAPTLVAATKLDSHTPVAPTPAAAVEVGSTLVAAAKAEPVTAPNYSEVALSKANPASLAMASVTRVEPSSAQLVAANPFMALKQVAVRDEALVDGSGKVVVNEPVVSFLPVVIARVAPESSIAIAPAANLHTDKALTVSIHAGTAQTATVINVARLAADNGDSSSRPPVVVASQLVVKEPASRIEVSTPAQTLLVQAPGIESTAPAHALVNRLDNPALVAATKLENQTTAAQANIPQSVVRVESAPVLVAAAKSDPGTIPLNRPEATQLQSGPVVQAITGVAKAEPAAAQSAVVSPFQSIKQVAVRNEVVLDGTGKVVVNESVSSPAPVIVASQLVVKDPTSGNEVSAPAKPAVAQAPGIESTAPAQLPVNRLDNPVLVAATKIETQTNAAQSSATQTSVNRVDNPVLVAATKIESQTNAAQSPITQAPAARVESAPVLVAAAKIEPGTAPVNRVEATQLQPSPVVQTIANVAKAEPASSQPVVANPFQSIKQVAVRNEAVLDGSGRVVVNEPVTSPTPVVSARVAPENPNTSAPAATTPFAVAPTSSTMARSTVENNDLSNRPPVIVASQLVVKDPVTRIEASKSAQPVVVQNSSVESTAPAQAPAIRLDNPVLVAAAKVENQSPVVPATAVKVESTPILVAATKVESPAPSISPAVRGDNAPVLVAAARVEPVANPANRGEVTLSQPSPAAQSVVTVAKVETASTQPLSTNPLPVNPFQSIKQVAVRDEAVVEGSGKVVVNESVVSHAPVVTARVAPENPNTASPVVTPFIVGPSAANSGSITLARSVVDSGDNNRPPVIAANQLVVKEPVLRSETVNPGQIVSTGPKSEAALPVVRVAGSDSMPSSDRMPSSSNPVVQDKPKSQPVAPNPFEDYTNVLAKFDGISDNSGKKVIAESVTQSVSPAEAPRPQPAAPNPFQGYSNVLAKADSVSDNSGKRVIAENVTQNIQPTYTPKALPVSPVIEVAAVRTVNNDNRESTLARNSAPVVMASQLAVKDAGGQNKTEGTTKNDSPARAEVLVKAEPVARVEPVTKLTENIKGSVPQAPAQVGNKSDVASVPAQVGNKSDVASVPVQVGTKSDAMSVPGQSGNKPEASVSSATVGISAPAASIAAVPATKLVDKQNGAEALAATNTLEGLFEAVGRSRAVASGDILTAKTSTTIEPTPLKTAADAKVVADSTLPGAKSVANVSLPGSRANNPEFQIVDSRAGLTIASADAAVAGSVLSPALQNGLSNAVQTAKTEGTSVKTEGQNAALDIKTPVRPGLKEGEGVTIAGAAVVTATSRSNAGGGGNSTAPATKAGVTGGAAAGAAGSGPITPGTTTSGTATPGSTAPGAATHGTTTPGATAPGTATPGTTTPGSATSATTTPGVTTPGTANAGGASPGTGTGTGTGTGAGSGLVVGHGGGSGIAGATGAAGAAGGVTAGAVVVPGGADSGLNGVNIAATTVPGTNDPAVTSNFTDPITSSSNQSGLTIDPAALQPLTLVDGEEVLDGRHKGETLTGRGPGKKNKADETTKEPESDRAGAAKTHGNGNAKNGKGRPQSADDVSLALAELERQKRAEAEKRRKLQEKARKQKAEQPRQVEKQRRCHILKGDTLESLALQYLGASNLATLIYKINQGFWWERRHANKIYLELLPGTIIFLPTTGEIAQFRDKLSCGKVKLLQFEYLSCEHVRSLRQLLAGARDKKALTNPSANFEQQCETIAQEEVAANLTENSAATVAVAPVAGTYVAFAANCDKKPSPLAVSFDAIQTGRLLIPGQVVVSDRLEEQSRVVELHNPQQSDSEHCQVQLQVWYSGQWLVVMEYVSSDNPVLNVHSLSGNKREIKMLLPASAVKSMALNDLTKNRLEYARRFLLGRKILV